MKRILLLLLLLTLPAQAETILIKRSGRKSKAILNKTFVFMQGAPQEAFERSAESSRPSSSQARRSSTNLGTLNKQLVKVKPVKVKPVKVKRVRKKVLVKASSKPSARSPGAGTQSGGGAPPQNIYDEDNWGDYAEYKTVEMGESLNVNAKITRY